MCRSAHLSIIYLFQAPCHNFLPCVRIICPLKVGLPAIIPCFDQACCCQKGVLQLPSLMHGLQQSCDTFLQNAKIVGRIRAHAVLDTLVGHQDVEHPQADRVPSNIVSRQHEQVRGNILKQCEDAGGGGAGRGGGGAGGLEEREWDIRCNSCSSCECMVCGTLGLLRQAQLYAGNLCKCANKLPSPELPSMTSDISKIAGNNVLDMAFTSGDIRSCCVTMRSMKPSRRPPQSPPADRPP